MPPSALFLFTRKKREPDKSFRIIQKMSFVVRRSYIVYVLPNFVEKLSPSLTLHC